MFPNLEAEMAREKISIKKLSELTGINYETLKLKFRGVTEFKLGEMLLVKRKVFNGETLDYLFATEEDPADRNLNDCALSASPGSGSLKDRMIAKAEYDAIQNCMKAVEEQPTAYDVENMISEVEVKMKAMWYFLDCHSAQCDNESGGDCGYCKKDFYDEIDKIVEQLKNELSNH